MNLHNGYQQYRNQSILTASPGDLVLMLYDGCLRQMKLASQAISGSHPEDAGCALLKAQDFVTELIQGLDFQYEVAQHLLRVYDYVNYQLIQANMKKDGQIIADLTDIMTELRGTWEQVIRINRGERPAAGE